MTERSLALQGRGIIVTRPEEQAAPLCRLIEEAGGVAYRMPLLAVQALPDCARTVDVYQPEHWDWVIFISANAVRFAQPWLAAWKQRPAIAAIGRSTAVCLEAAGIRVDLTPELEFNSEGLLACPEMAALSGQRILIVRGRGGREHLGLTLAARGADVTYAEVYQRVPVRIDPEFWRGLWQEKRFHALTLTSGEALDHLHEALGSLARAWAESLPLAVIGGRIGQLASARGWQRVAVARSASDAGLLAAVMTLIDTGS